MVATISSCLESIRMVRDKVQRNQVWSSLGGWATELVVERALFSAGRNISPSSALMRIMEVVASGLQWSCLIGRRSRTPVRWRRPQCSAL